ncbi:condensation domain-containing protein [Williamsia sp. SKLECPSW1]
MVSFGLIDEWQPTPGRVRTWSATADSRAAAAAAPVHPIPPSYQQQAYLRSARRHRDAGFRFSRLCLLAFRIDGPLDVDVMTRTVETFLRRHDTFLSWFSVEDDGTVERHVVDPGSVRFAPTDHGEMDDAAAILDHVQATTPGPDRWDCFTVGTIEHGSSFTVYLAVDHLHSDGVSQALSCVDLLSMYGADAAGTTPVLMPAGSYLDYCARERASGADLRPDDPRVARWTSLIRENGGRLPNFPLDLDIADEGYTRSRMISVPLLDTAGADRLEATARRHGAGVAATVLTVAAILSYEFAGRDRYLGFTPRNTRTTAEEFNSVGWFTNLIPVTTSVDERSSFSSLVGGVQQSFDAGKSLSDLSLHRVLELVGADSGIDVPEGWVVPMVSYLDVRRLPGAAMFDHIDAEVYGNRGSSEEVFIWVTHFPDRVLLTMLLPDTERARAAIDTYASAFLQVVSAIADTGDHQVTPRDTAGVRTVSSS